MSRSVSRDPSLRTIPSASYIRDIADPRRAATTEQARLFRLGQTCDFAEPQTETGATMQLSADIAGLELARSMLAVFDEPWRAPDNAPPPTSQPGVPSPWDSASPPARRQTARAASASHCSHQVPVGRRIATPPARRDPISAVQLRSASSNFRDFAQLQRVPSHLRGVVATAEAAASAHVNTRHAARAAAKPSSTRLIGRKTIYSCSAPQLAAPAIGRVDEVTAATEPEASGGPATAPPAAAPLAAAPPAAAPHIHLPVGRYEPGQGIASSSSSSESSSPPPSPANTCRRAEVSRGCRAPLRARPPSVHARPCIKKTRPHMRRALPVQILRLSRLREGVDYRARGARP